MDDVYRLPYFTNAKQSVQKVRRPRQSTVEWSFEEYRSNKNHNESTVFASALKRQSIKKSVDLLKNNEKGEVKTYKSRKNKG